MIDDALTRLKTNGSRSIRRRPKRGDFDPWDEVRVSCNLFAVSLFFLGVGWLFQPLGSVSLALIIFGGLLFPFALPICLSALIKIQAHRALIKRGHAAIGEVTSTEAHNYPDFGSYHKVSYKFFTDDGIEVMDEWQNADKPFWHSKKGDTFIVIYKPNRPTDHIAYKASLYEAK